MSVGRRTLNPGVVSRTIQTDRRPTQRLTTDVNPVGSEPKTQGPVCRSPVPLFTPSLSGSDRNSECRLSKRLITDQERGPRPHPHQTTKISTETLPDTESIPTTHRVPHRFRLSVVWSVRSVPLLVWRTRVFRTGEKLKHK